MALTTIRNRRRAATTVIALGIAPVFAAGAWLTPAAAAEGDSSRAAARFLAGDVAGVSLDIPELSGAQAENAGQPEPVTTASPLDAAALGAVEVPLPGGTPAALSSILQIEAVNQWATAEDGGASHAATGAVADNGGVGTGVEAGFPGNVTIDLTQLVGDALSGVVSELALELDAVSSEAHLVPAEDGTFEVTRDSEVAGGRLTLTVPALAEVVPQLEAAIGDVQATVDGLAGPEGTITGAVNSLQALLDLLETAGAKDVEVTATLEADLQAALQEFLSTPLGEGTGVLIDLANGTVVLDLDVLLGGLDDQAPNTEVLSAAVLDQVGPKIGEVLDSIAPALVASLEEALRAATLDLTVHASVQDPLLGTELGTLDLTLSDTLGAIVAGEAEFVDGSSGIVPALIAPLLAETLTTLVGTVGTTLDDTLFGEGGALATLGETVSGALATVGGTLATVGDVLAQVLSIKLNVQPDQAAGLVGELITSMPLLSGVFDRATDGPLSIAALQVTAMPSAPVATITLAQSEVGANTVGDGGTETEVEGTEVEGVETEVEGVEVEGAETEVEGTEVEGVETEVEGVEVEGAEVEGTETEVEGAEVEVEGTETEVAGGEVEGTETEVAGGEVEVAGGETEVAGGEVEVAGAEVEGTETEVAGGETEVAGGEVEVAGGEVEVAGGETEVAGGETEVAGAEVEGAETEVAGAETEVTGAETEVAGAETEVAGAETEVTGAETEVAGAEVAGGETEVEGAEVEGAETEVAGVEVAGSETEVAGDTL